MAKVLAYAIGINSPSGVQYGTFSPINESKISDFKTVQECFKSIYEKGIDIEIEGITFEAKIPFLTVHGLSIDKELLGKAYVQTKGGTRKIKF